MATEIRKATNRCERLSGWKFLQQIYSRVFGMLDPKMDTVSFETSQLFTNQQVYHPRTLGSSTTQFVWTSNLAQNKALGFVLILVACYSQRVS